MKLVVLIFFSATCIVTSDALSQDTQSPKKSKISFSNDVFPIIKKRCLPCHASDSENPSEFFMESLPEIMKGGKHGNPIIPKKGDESILVQKIKPTPPFGEQMPLMSKKKLTDEEIELFKTWIDQGAKKN
jgi:Planctomycete cytochrome C.